MMRGLKKVYFRTLELLGGSEEILIFWTPGYKIKPHILVPNSSFFSTNWTEQALPHIFGKDRARDPCEASIALYWSLVFISITSSSRNYLQGFKFMF
jgi:hypothetical protein